MVVVVGVVVAEEAAVGVVAAFAFAGAVERLAVELPAADSWFLDPSGPPGGLLVLH